MATLESRLTSLAAAIGGAVKSDRTRLPPMAGTAGLPLVKTNSAADGVYAPAKLDLTALSAPANSDGMYIRVSGGVIVAAAGPTLGTAASKNIGTSGNTVPVLDGANTWGAQQNFDYGATSATGALTDSSGRVATTAFVKSQGYATTSGNNTWTATQQFNGTTWFARADNNQVRFTPPSGYDAGFDLVTSGGSNYSRIFVRRTSQDLVLNSNTNIRFEATTACDFTGSTVIAATASAGDSSNKAATTAFVQSAIVKGLKASVTGTMAASEIVLIDIAAYSGSLTATNSFAKSNVAASASTTLTIKRAGTAIGSIVFAAGATLGTITINTPTVTYGDLVTITGASTADTTLADIAILLRIA